jgi:choline dehydrogenase
MKAESIIIIGAGAAGLFCARQLAGHADVTLLEGGVDAGDPPPRWLLDDLVLSERLDWGYVDAVSGMALLRGRVTGGSTSTNAAAALRGQPWDYDGWGLPQWTWERCLDGFRAIETDRQFADRPEHGADGPLPVTRLPFGPLDESFVTWCRQAGHSWVEDQNHPGALGIGHWPTNMIEPGRRWGAHAAVLPDLRSALTLRSSTVAKALRFEDGLCWGVEVDGPNGCEVLEADRVICCAGAYGTPELLLRSGVGPAAMLQAAGIDVVVDLPGVGANLQEHPWSVMRVRATDPQAPGMRPVNGSLLRYEVPGITADRVEAHIYPHQALPYFPDADPDEVLVGVGLMRAVSRGQVRLDRDGATQITLNLFGAEQDRQAYARALAHADDYLRAMVAAGVFHAPADTWWREGELAWAENVITYGHAVGTCAMGAEGDLNAVVDEALAVRGVSALSVADASVMPISPRANTMLSSMMIGWRAGERLAGELVTPQATCVTGATQMAL